MTSTLFVIVRLILTILLIILLIMIFYGLIKAEAKLKVTVEELEGWVKVLEEFDEVIIKIDDATGRDIDIVLDH